MSNKRLRFDRAEAREDGEGGAVVEVYFSFGDRIILTSSRAAEGALKAAAEATLAAVEQAVEGRFTGTLVDLDQVNALGKDLIAVLVDLQFEGRQVQTFGSCPVTGRRLDAAVKATLNATNRFFELAMR